MNQFYKDLVGDSSAFSIPSQSSASNILIFFSSDPHLLTSQHIFSKFYK